MTEFIQTDIPGLVLIKPKVFEDDRGYFFESFNLPLFTEQVGPINFIQDSESNSSRGILRGLHYQLPPFEQAKLVRVVQGKVLDVAVDIRRDSPTYAKHVAVELSAENKHQLFIPKGFAHGFVVLSESALFHYKVDNTYSPDHERGIRYDDSTLAIEWTLPAADIQVSAKDQALPALEDR